MLDIKKIKPEPYTKDEKEFLDELVKKYGKGLGTKEEKYRVFKQKK